MPATLRASVLRELWQPMGKPERICVLRLSAIGDCVHALAVVRALQRGLPDTEISWVIGSTEATLMKGVDGVELIVIDKRADRQARKAIAAHLSGRQFDVLLNMHASWRANFVSRWIRAPRKIGFDRARARDAQWLFTNERIASQHHPHVIDGMMGFAAHLGVKRGDLEWRLPIAEDDYAFAGQFVSERRPLVVISPCSSQRARNFRNWPVERFVEVVRHAVQRYDARVVLTGSGTALELEYASTLLEAEPDAVHDLVGKSTLKQLAALIDRASCVICPDSGPVHIATAVGTPVIGLYATSNPERTGPAQHAEHTVNAYPEALHQYMNRSIETVRWGQRVRHPDAMSLIQAADVVAQLDSILN